MYHTFRDILENVIKNMSPPTLFPKLMNLNFEKIRGSTCFFLILTKKYSDYSRSHCLRENCYFTLQHKLHIPRKVSQVLEIPNIANYKKVVGDKYKKIDGNSPRYLLTTYSVLHHL